MVDRNTIPLYRDLVCSALDGAMIEANWCARFLENDNDVQAVAAFERTMAYIRLAAKDLNIIRVAMPVHDPLTVESAVEYRANRKPFNKDLGGVSAPPSLRGRLEGVSTSPMSSVREEVIETTPSSGRAA